MQLGLEEVDDKLLVHRHCYRIKDGWLGEGSSNQTSQDGELCCMLELVGFL